MIKPAQLVSEATKTPGNGLLCLSIDLEVGIKDERIHSFAAVRGDNGASFVFQTGNLQDALRKLDAFSGPMAFLLGHNIIAFDAPHLAAAQPDLRLLKLPLVDTLQLNPLAFPRNPYHHLVKHYKDGQLQHGSLNDPELDARLTLEVFNDQLRAFEDLQHSAPELLLRYVRLTMKDIGVGFAGRFAEDHPVHGAIAALSAGDALALRQTEARWELVNNAGVTVGRLSKAFTSPANMHCISAQVAAIICRKREDSDPAQQNYSRCEHWEIVMAELVFAP